MITESLLEAERLKFEQRSQKVLAILSKKDEQIIRLEEELRIARDGEEMSRMQQENEILQSRATDLSEQVEILVAEVASLRNASETKRDLQMKENESLNKRAIEAEMAKHKTLEQLSKAELKISSLEDANKSFKKKTDELNEFLRRNTTELENCKDKNARLEKILETAKETLLKKENELNYAKDSLASVLDSSKEHPSEQRSRQLQIQVKNLVQELNQTKMELAESQQSLLKRPETTDLSVQKAIVEKQNAQNDELQSLQDIIVKQSEELVALRKDLVAATANERQISEHALFEKRKLTFRIRQLEQKYRHATENIETARRQLATTVNVLSGKSDLHFELARLGEEITELNTSNSELEVRNRLLTAEVEDWNTRCQHLESCVKEQEDALNDYRRADAYKNLPENIQSLCIQGIAYELENCKRQLRQREQVDASIAQEIRKSQKIATEEYKSVELESFPTQSSGELAVLNERQKVRWITSMQLALRNYQSELLVKSNLFEELTERYEQLVEKLDAQQHDHEKQNLVNAQSHANQLAIFNSRIVELVQESQILLDTKTETTKDLELTKASVIELESLVQSLREMLRSNANDSSDAIGALKKANDQLHNQLESLNSINIEYRTRISVLEESLDVIQGQHIEDPATREEIIANLASRLSVAEAKHGELQRKILNIEYKAKNIENREEEARQLESKHLREKEEADYLLSRELNNTKTLKEKVYMLQQQVGEVKSVLSATQLKNVDHQSTIDRLVVERDSLLRSVSELKVQHAADLNEERRKYGESLASYERFANADDKSSRWNTKFKTMKSDLENIVQELNIAYNRFTSTQGIDDSGMDPLVLSFSKLTDFIRDNEIKSTELEARCRYVTWERDMLRSQLSTFQGHVMNATIEQSRLQRSMEQLKRAKDVEVNLRSKYFENELSSERNRFDELENLFLKIQGMYQVKCRQLRSYELEFTDHRDSIVSNEAGTVQERLFVELKGAQDCIAQLRLQVKESVLRLHEYKVSHDGVDEKRKDFIENEKLVTEKYKQEISSLREQLINAKRELVEMAFDYESRLARTPSQEDGPMVPSEMNALLLQQTKEISDLHVKVTDLEHNLTLSQSQLQRKRRETTEAHANQSLLGRMNVVEQKLDAKQDSEVLQLRKEVDILASRLEEATSANQVLSHANAKVVHALGKYQKYFENRGRVKKQPNTEPLEESTVGLGKISDKLESLLLSLEGEELSFAVSNLQHTLDKYHKQAHDILHLTHALRDKDQEIATLRDAFSKQKQEALEQARVGEVGLKVTNNKLSKLMKQYEKLAKVADRHASAADDLGAIKRGYDELSRLRVSLESTLASAQATVEEKSAAIESLTDQLDHLTELLQDKDLEIRTMTEKLDDLRVQKQRLHQEQKPRESREGEEKQEMTQRDLLARIEKLNRKVKNGEQKLEDANASVERVKEQLASIKKTWADPQSWSQLKQELQEVKSQLKSTKQVNSKQVKALHEQLGKRRSATDGVDTLYSRIASLENKVKSCEQDGNNKERLIQSQRGTMDQLKNKLHDTEVHAQHLQKKIDSLSKDRLATANRVSMMELQVQQLKNKLDQVPDIEATPEESSNESQLRTFNAEIVSLRSRVANIKAKLRSTNEQLEAKTEECGKLESQLAEVNAKHKKLKSAIASMEEEKASLVEELETVTTEARLAKSEMEAIRVLTMDTLLRITDETMDIKTSMYHSDSTDTLSRLSDMTDSSLTTEDLRNIMDADARVNDPKFRTSFENARKEVENQKSAIRRMFSQEAGLLSRLQSGEFRNLVFSICTLWRQS